MNSVEIKALMLGRKIVIIGYSSTVSNPTYKLGLSNVFGRVFDQQPSMTLLLSSMSPRLNMPAKIDFSR
jgi:hypothetical protein